MERLPLFHVVRFDSLPIHSAELQSAEIRFTYSQEFCERHTLVFESQAQNRVHVETALIFITPAARHATDGRHLRRIMCVKQCDCNNCYKRKPVLTANTALKIKMWTVIQREYRGANIKLIIR